MSKRAAVQCPNCGQQFNAIIENIIDPAQDPEGKLRLLSGQANVTRCPNCGYAVTMSSPILYHDASKELLLTFVPMELNLPKQQQEKAIGDMMRELTGRLPKESMRGYLFQPRQMLTLQGMIDTVLQADGVTPEMMEQQKNRVRLLETLLQTPEDKIVEMIHQRDAEIDGQLFQTLTLMGQRMVQEGRSEIAEQMVMLQEYLLAESSYGNTLLQQSQQQQETVQQVSEEIEAMGQDADRSDFLELALRYANDDMRLQALVGLVRPVFDQQFFQELTIRMAKAPAEERPALEAVEDALTTLTQLVDQQQQQVVQRSAQLLGLMINAPDLDAVIQESLPMLDDTFLAVLQANLEEAERQKDIQTSGRLRDIYNRVLTALRQNMRPELKFINDLLGATSEAEAQQMIAEQAPSYGPILLEMMDAVEGVLASRGDEVVRERLLALREQTARVLS